MKFLAYFLIVLSILKIGSLYMFTELSDSVTTVKLQWDEMGKKVNRVSTFEDSLIYNVNFRLQVLDTISEEVSLKDILALNNIEKVKVLKELDELSKKRNELIRHNNIYQGLDILIDVLSVISIFGIGILWIKNKSN